VIHFYKRSDEETPCDVFPGFRVADSRELMTIMELRSVLYHSTFGYHGIDVHDRDSVHWVACLEGRIVAALRLVGPTPVPLEIERFASLQDMFGPGVRLMQVGGFWLAPAYRRLTKATVGVALRLLDKAIQFATRLEVAVLVLRTTKPLTKWYASLGFQRLCSLDYIDPAYGAVFTMCRVLDPAAVRHALLLHPNDPYSADAKG
jgi:predicted GNAT family N-acyltransferase